MTEIHIRTEGRAGRITLTRPRALNALGQAMVHALAAALDRWRDDPAVDLVLIDAQGPRAFCAGGDLTEIYAAGRAGDFDTGRRFWAAEYRMNARIASYAKPYVSLTQGFVMGGGVGISGHGTLRITGETTLVSMPECGIGLIPDVGGTALLARAPGRLGEYLGLTGHRMGPGDAIHAGFADYFVPQHRWPDLTAHLVATGDPGVILDYTERPPVGDLASLRPAIDDTFDAPDLATLIVRLEASDWGHGVLKILRRHSPLSMACALELIRAARHEPGVTQALTREFRFTSRAASDADLLEGIRAAIIDKDRAPVWRHDLDDVPRAEIAAMLAPLGPDDLTLPGRERL